MNIKKLTQIIIISTLISGLICLLVLPQSVAVQWSGNVAVESLPGWQAILLTFAVAALFLLISGYSSRRYAKLFANREKAERNIANVFTWLGFSGIALQLLLLIMNR